MNELDTEPRPDLEQVYRVERTSLVRLAVLLVGSRELAEDVVQTVFAAAQPRWSSIVDHRAYLRRAVVNQANDAHRRRFRQAPILADEPVTLPPEMDETWSEIKRLPAAQRTVVVLRFYEDLPLTEIARILDRPEGTVRSSLHRALNRLRRTLP